MGRSLSNTMINLGIETECEEALYEASWCTISLLSYTHSVRLL